MSPHPIIEMHVLSHISAEDGVAAENMIFKLCIPNTVVCNACDEEKARSSATFWKKHGEILLLI